MAATTSIGIEAFAPHVVEDPSRVLLVTADSAVRERLAGPLSRRGYRLTVVAEATQGLNRALSESFQLLVIDTSPPGRTGLDLCRDVRRCGSEVPVLMLTERGNATDCVAGLELGADDYVTKPLDMSEAMARIDACLRRRGNRYNAQPKPYRFGAVEVDFRKGEVACDGMPVSVSAKEFLLLKYFIQHKGALLTRNELLDGVWGYDAMPYTRTVDTHVSWLRKKLEPVPRHPRFILTIHRLGYKFVG